MVKGCLACCCLGIPMMLGDPLLGLPMLLLLPAPTPALAPPLSPPTSPPVGPVGPPTCWLWFSTLRLLIGRIPLQRTGRRHIDAGRSFDGDQIIPAIVGIYSDLSAPRGEDASRFFCGSKYRFHLS